MNVFNNIEHYDSSRGELFPWAYTIVRNAAISHLKSKKHDPVNVEITEMIEQVAQYSPFMEMEWERIYYYLDKLPPATRAVCTLYYMEGYAIKEIAEQLSLSEGTIKWHLSESRYKLKALTTNNTITESA